LNELRMGKSTWYVRRKVAVRAESPLLYASSQARSALPAGVFGIVA